MNEPMYSAGDYRELAKAQVMYAYQQTPILIEQERQWTMLGAETMQAKYENNVIQVWTGMEEAQRTDEREEYPSTQRALKGQIPYNPVKYAQSYSITEEMVERYTKQGSIPLDSILSEVQELTYKVEVKNEWKAGRVFSNAFNTSYRTVVDGGPLIDANHPITRPRIGGVTHQSNYLGSVPLTPQNLEDAKTMLFHRVDDRGMPMPRPKRMRLVVAPELYTLAQKIVQSPGNYTNPNLTVNINQDIEIVTNHYLGENAKFYWFLMDVDMAPKNFKRVVAWETRMRETNDYLKGVTDIFTFSTSFDFILLDYHWIVGSDATSI